MFGNIFKQLTIREDIVKTKEKLFEEEPSTVNRMIMQKAQVVFKKYLHYEGKFWKQKAVYDWFKEGDRNIKFFHILVKGRRKRLQLTRIQKIREYSLKMKARLRRKQSNFTRTN